MGKAFLYILLAIILISLLRGVIGILGKAFTSLAEPPAGAGVRQGGELKRDPVCGTYVAANASVKRTIRGEEVHFCSAACSKKYSG